MSFLVIMCGPGSIQSQVMLHIVFIKDFASTFKVHTDYIAGMLSKASWHVVILPLSASVHKLTD